MKFEQYLIESEITNIKKELKGTDGYLKAPNGKKSNLPEKQWLMVRTKSFKKWFGDWENSPDNASKILDGNGEPMIVYHQTDSDFTEFDLSKILAAKGDPVTPFGIFLKKNDDNIGLNGNIQMSLYAKMKSPMEFNDRPHIEKYLSKNIDGWEDLVREKNDINARFNKRSEEKSKKMMDAIRDAMQDITDQAERGLAVKKIKDEYKTGDMFKEWRDLIDINSMKSKKLITKHFKSKGHDGVIIHSDSGSFGRVTDAMIVFEPNQIKSINNKGSFGKTNNINENEE